MRASLTGLQRWQLSRCAVTLSRLLCYPVLIFCLKRERRRMTSLHFFRSTRTRQESFLTGSSVWESILHPQRIRLDCSAVCRRIHQPNTAISCRRRVGRSCLRSKASVRSRMRQLRRNWSQMGRSGTVVCFVSSYPWQPAGLQSMVLARIMTRWSLIMRSFRRKVLTTRC